MSKINEQIATDESIISWLDSESLYEGGYPQLNIPKGCGAIMILNGSIMEIKDEGKNDLSSENFPLSSSKTDIINPNSGLKALFFKKNISNLKFGLSRLMLQDQDSTMLNLQIIGNVNFVISDVKKFVENFIGLNTRFEKSEFSLIAVKRLEPIVSDVIIQECKKQSIKNKIRLSSAEIGNKVSKLYNESNSDNGFTLDQVSIEEISLL